MSASDVVPDPVERQQGTVSVHESRITIWDSTETISAYRAQRASAHPIRVLLAEDNLIDQVSIRRLLVKMGVEVKLAGDGRQAADVFECGLFDLVLLDILMPNIDGFEAAVLMREKERSSNSRIPIIALTSYSLNAVYDKCKSVRMSGYLSKPVVNSDLRALFAALQIKPAVEKIHRT
jgi:CheY-like chemotaxis protein